MNNQFLKIFFSVTFLLTGFLFLNVEKVHAECVVLSANFRVVNAQGQPTQITPSSWYTETAPPFAYIDIQTSGCSGPNSFNLSVTELDDQAGLDNVNDDDLEGFDNRPISVSVPNFTLVVRVGENECESVTTNSFDCQNYIRINDDVLGGVNDFSQTSTLVYDCDGTCQDDNYWVYITEIAYQSVYSGDTLLQQNNQNNQGGNSSTSGPGIAGQDIDINIQNPIGPSDMTLVDFIQKVIDFALTIGIPIIAIAIIYAGLLFVTARGNDKQLETAKNAFTYAVIGGAILLGSFIFAKLIKDTIETIAMINIYFG